MADETNGQASAPAEGEAAQAVDEPKKIDPEPEAEPAKPAEKAAGEEGEGDGDDDSTDEEGQPRRKNRSGSQRAKRREAFLLEELRAKERRLEELERKAPTAGGEVKDEAPKEEDFNGDWTAYVAAKAAHEAAKAVGKTLDDRAKTETDRRQADHKREQTLAHLERVEEAKETIADWDQVIGSAKGLTIHEDVMSLIIESDKSPLLAYHLAKNPDKLRELNSMSAREQAREIGRLEGSIRMPAGKKQTTAPPPPKNLQGGVPTPASWAQSDNMDDFAKGLKASLEKRRAGQR